MISELLKSKLANLLEVKMFYITESMFNAGRKAGVLDEFGVWAFGIIKENISESFKESF